MARKKPTASSAWTRPIPGRGLISWVSPLARALLKARKDDVVVMQVPGGREELEIVEVSYRTITLD